jgi:Protein of unknown function (DUF2911)
MKQDFSIIICVLLLIAITACNNNNKTEKVEDDSTPQQAAVHTMHEETGGYADSVNDGLIAMDTMKGSPHRVAMGNINGKHIHIEYGSPGVKGRIIWGGLVPYDKVWVTGAHSATNITFSDAVTFGDKKIAAGKYALFTIPGKEKWTVILNKKYEQHLADDYNETEDAARITVTPEVSDKIVQRLTYTVDQTGEQKGEIVMQWEKITLSIPLSFQ